MSAAPAMTRQNARQRALMASAPEPIGSWKTRMPRAHRPAQRPRRPFGEVFDRDVGDSEQRPGGGTEEQSLASPQDQAAGRDPYERGTEGKDGAFDGDQRRQRGALGAVGAPASQADDRQSGCGDRHADPLPLPEAKAEEPLGEHGEEDEPAGEDRLHDRQRRERESADVQAPGEDRHDPSDGKPSRGKETGGAADRVADLDRRGEHRAAVLEQKGDVGAQRRRERQEQSHDHGSAGRLAGRSYLAGPGWSAPTVTS
jgi:hypothetical protein